MSFTLGPPTDRTRPPILSTDYDLATSTLPEPLVDAFRAFAFREGISLRGVFLAAHQALRAFEFGIIARRPVSGLRIPSFGSRPIPFFSMPTTSSHPRQLPAVPWNEGGECWW